MNVNFVNILPRRIEEEKVASVFPDNAMEVWFAEFGPRVIGEFFSQFCFPSYFDVVGKPVFSKRIYSTLNHVGGGGEDSEAGGVSPLQLGSSLSPRLLASVFSESQNEV